MACNDPFHAVFDDVIAFMDETKPYTITVKEPSGTTKRKRLQSYNGDKHSQVCDLIDAARISAVREVANGTRNGFDLLRIDRDAERLERRSKGKRYGAAQRRIDTIGNGRVVDTPRNSQSFTASSFLDAVRKQRP